MHYGTIRKLKEVGIPTTNRVARKLVKEDYNNYDYIIGMENSNIRNINKIICYDNKNKIYRLLDFSDNPRDIADPWYNGLYLFFITEKHRCSRGRNNRCRMLMKFLK